MKIKHIENIGGKIQVDTEVFDKIVLAGPIDVQIQNVKYPQYDMNYQSTVVSYFKGKLNVEYLKCSKEIGCPDVVLVGESGRQKLFFNSIQRMADVNGELTDIYKVFSERVLTSEQISKLFKKVHEINEVDWLAYPKYDLSLNLSKIQFKLTDSIFTTQPIELAASCIEMSLIGAHNVANLILSDPTVPAEPVKQIKTEL